MYNNNIVISLSLIIVQMIFVYLWSSAYAIFAWQLKVAVEVWADYHYSTMSVC